MIKTECVNCTKSTFCGKDAVGNLRFGCNNPFCVKEEIINMKFRNETIEELKNNGKNSGNN